ncbi:nucleotidyltransferase domain-containing protein [Streptacidiphilus fuscans]|uniref:Nucleotidyltransferase domain-containing protein n=1 Tax=Streptacidiphilus fuscans TaxID=2789292 RepID=A0A931FHM9_9ACTN|nr:nucleotidyltransferase domain-containing protein [Streptacidiphilus fuscans]MBF9070849.1 nucleotidyltransferase domain-containing protein [Streptacidiphilus fuscans]
MKISAPSLLPLFRSRLQGDLLALVLLHPDHRWTLTALAQELGVSHTAVLREADRLVGAEILSEERVGRTRVVSARTDTVLYRPLCDLLLVTYGPMPRLSALLSDLGGVQEAYIYGSWAARYQGEPGPIPADIDVLVIGRPDPDELFDLAERASRELHREVNAHRVTPEVWASPSDEPFLVSVRERPLVRLSLHEEKDQ